MEGRPPSVNINNLLNNSNMGFNQQQQYQNNGGNYNYNNNNSNFGGYNPNFGGDASQMIQSGIQNYQQLNNNSMSHQQSHSQNYATNAQQYIGKIGDLPILVRELWIGGLPTKVKDKQLGKIMDIYGEIEALELFDKPPSNFAYVKFR